jgi:hypothetical protein
MDDNFTIKKCADETLEIVTETNDKIHSYLFRNNEISIQTKLGHDYNGIILDIEDDGVTIHTGNIRLYIKYIDIGNAY